MLRIFFTGGIFQFLNAGLGIVKVKYFLDLQGAAAMGDIASITAIWGLIALLTDDIKLMFRTGKLKSQGVRRDVLIGLKSNLLTKIPIICCAITVISIQDGLRLSITDVFTILVIAIGYILTISTSVLIGKMEKIGKFHSLNVLQSFNAILNLWLFFPLTYFLSGIGFLINVTISSNLLFVSLYFTLRHDKSTEISTRVNASDLQALTKSKIYLYVIVLQACTYVFDPMLISYFVSDLEAVEYSLVRRMGLILTVSTLSLGPFFSSLGTNGLNKLSNLGKHLFSIALASTVLYLGVSSLILDSIFESAPPKFIQYQIGMVFLGISSIMTSSLISSHSSEKEVYLRFLTLIGLVPLYLICEIIGILLIGGFFPLYLGAVFLATYAFVLRVFSEKS